MFLERNSNGDKLPEVFKKKEECSKEKNTKVSKASELSHVPSQPQASGSSKSSVGLAEAAGEEICLRPDAQTYERHLYFIRVLTSF
jgi:hypothetical protein